MEAAKLMETRSSHRANDLVTLHGAVFLGFEELKELVEQRAGWCPEREPERPQSIGSIPSDKPSSRPSR